MTTNEKDFDKAAKELGIKPTENKDFNELSKLKEELLDIVKVLDEIEKYKPLL